jgi:hypothetical protein
LDITLTQLQITPADPQRDDVSNFDCGHADLNDYIRVDCPRHISNRISHTRLAEYELAMTSPLSPFEMAEPEKPKRGRRTVPDNFLLGSRNNWLSMFEENWADIGFPLLEIRRTGRGTIDDVRKVFDSFEGTDTGAFSKVFLQGTPQQVTGKEIRANRLFNSTVHRNIEGMRSRQANLMRSHAEVEHALEEPGYQDNEILQTQEKQIKGRLLQLEEDLGRAERELPQFDQQKRDQESYWYCFEFHPLGLVVEVAKRFAIADFRRKEWDFVDTVNLLSRQSDSQEKRKADYEKERVILNYWKYQPRARQAYLIINGLIAFEDMLAIDEKGDAFFPFPHVFVDFSAQKGPLKWFFHSFRIGQALIPLPDEFKRTHFFPDIFPSRQERRIYRDRVVELDPQAVRGLQSDYPPKNIFDIAANMIF